MPERSPRIALLLPALPLAQWWGPVIAEMNRRLDDVRVFTAQGWVNLETDPNRHLVTVVGTTQRLASTAGAGAYGGGVMRLSPRVLWPLWRFRPDAVIAMGFSLWTLLALLTRPLARWRVIILWEGSSPGVDRRDSRLNSSLRRWMGRRADWVMTSNSRSRQYLTDHLGLEPTRILVHPYLVGSPQAMLAGGGDASDVADATRPRLLHLGRLEPRKGLAELLDALAPLAGKTPFTLLAIGTGHAEQDLQDQAVANGLSDQVRWLGWRDYQTVGAYIADADLLVFPTLEDTWGMVAVEAMALGTPVLCSVHAGASEVLTDGQDGILVDPTDPRSLADALRSALVTADLAGLGERAKATAVALTPAAAAQALIAAAAAGSRRRSR